MLYLFLDYPLTPLVKGRQLESVAKWPTEWFFECTIMLAANEPDAIRRNIVQIYTTGTGSGQYGSRVVALYTEDFNKIYFSSHYHEANGDVLEMGHKTSSLTLGKIYDIAIRHVRDNAAGNFRYEIHLNGSIHHEINWKTEDLRNIKVYVSGPWQDPSSISIKNLKYGAL